MASIEQSTSARQHLRSNAHKSSSDTGTRKYELTSFGHTIDNQRLKDELESKYQEQIRQLSEKQMIVEQKLAQ
jgi:hypothetical protein